MNRAIVESQKPITTCMKPSSTMGIEVRKPNAHATTCMKLASIAGVAITGGGMRTSIAGGRNATGAMTITNTIAVLEYDDRPAGTHPIHLVLCYTDLAQAMNARGGAGSRFDAGSRTSFFSLSITS